MTRAQIWMAGPSLTAPGGMSAVVTSYRDAGLFMAWQVRYLNTYDSPGLAVQLRTFGRAVVTLGWALLRGRVAVLHVHSASRGSCWRKSVLCGMARLAGVPYLFHIHSGEFPVFFERECGPLARRWIRSTCRHAQAVVVLTASWQVALQRLMPEARFVVLPNPVKLPDLAPAWRASHTRLLFLGRVRQKKGAFDLLRAMVAVAAAVPAVTLVMAGDGEIAAAQALCVGLGLAGRVHFTGWIEGADKDRAMRDADIFVLPSYFEGLPIGVLEAMAAGLVVVASPVGGIPDLVTDGVEASLVPAGDVPRLAAALVRLLESNDVANALASAAWLRVQAYDVNGVVAHLGQIYTRALKARRGGA